VDVEAAAAGSNLTLGLPSGSSEAGTIGGWVAAGAGSDAPHGDAGRVVALTAVLAGGQILRLPSSLPPGGPARLLHGLVVGTEGSLAVVTEATLAASRAPASWAWEAFGPHAFDSGAALAREVSQGPFRPSALALLDEAEAFAWMPPDPLWQRTRPVLLVGFDAAAPGVEAERFELRRVARELGARSLGPEPGEYWWEHRRDPLAWREAIMGPDRALGPGVVVDTVDVGAPWRRCPHVYADVRGALLDHAEEVRCRLEAAAATGAGLTFTFVVRRQDDRAAERAYREAWAGAVRASLAAGGSLARHQGVGLVRVAWVAGEVGEAGASALRRVKFALDPQGVMNPGKLIPAGDLAADLAAPPAAGLPPASGGGP
jgi:alkyldihydroxyacetonephosphate synthase